MKISTIINVLKVLIKLNLVKTVYFNFKCLPFKKSIKLPIHFYGRTKFESLDGKIFINTEKVHFGMISFGGNHEIVTSSNQPTRIIIKGLVHFNGFSKFGKGVNLVVWKNGKVIFGSNFSIGSNSNIISFKKIQFGDNNLISWYCDFYDTDFHFIKNIITSEIKDNCGELTVGNNVWIGSKSTVLKDTTIPNNCIVGTNSLCKGDYLKKFHENIIIGGNPATLLKKDFVYVHDKQIEKELFNKYINY